MSDKSKLGFNINPKNYDELNSTDNLITSGSDSGWLGKKLQGDDSNDLDLSKINPLFDKELYEKYRPGVNTNDGSVNQDIWGYKCFNSPVSFRNGIYGDTYSIKSIEGDNITTGAYDGISIQPCQKNIIHDCMFDSQYYSYKLHSDIIGVTHDKCVTSAYTGKMLHPITFNEPTNYQLFSNAIINGSSIENMTLTSTAYTRYYCQSYIYNNPSDTDLHIYNGVKIYSEINSKSEYTDEINIVSSKCDTSGSRFPYKASRITVGTDCSDDPTLEQVHSVSGNCIRMYSANGNEYSVDHTNDNISSIIITPDYISMSAKNNASQSTDNPYIKIDGIDNSITLHAGKLNLPSTIETTAKFANKASALSKEINSANYIYATDNSILPNDDSTISLGDLKTKYNTIYTNKLIATDESTLANLIIKKNLTYSDFNNHVVKYKLINTSKPGVNHAVTQSYKSNYANNDLSILYTESFNIGTDRRSNIYKEYGLKHGICIYGDDDHNGVSNIAIGSTSISILDPVRPLYAIHAEVVTSNMVLKRNHSSFKIGTINAVDSDSQLKSIIITPTHGDIYDIYVFRINAHYFPYTVTNLIGLSTGKNGLILPGTILLPRLHVTAEDPYYYTRVVVENTIDSAFALQKDDVVFSGFNASQSIAEYGDYYVVLEHIDDLAYEVLETVFIKSGEAYFKCKVKIVDRYAAEKFSTMI